MINGTSRLLHPSLFSPATMRGTIDETPSEGIGSDVTEPMAIRHARLRF